MPKTMLDKIWDAHEVAPGLIYIDLHMVHEVTSPQAFDGLRMAGRKVRRPDRTLATADHNVPTDGSKVAAQIADHPSRVQGETLRRNCAEFGIPIYSLGSERSEEHTSELQSQSNLVCRLLLEKKKICSYSI